ncbi:MAG: hypothetical protein AB1345_11000 [Chloroflexota bacterium]
MDNWKSLLHQDATDWLLEKTNPSVRYFTYRWLLDKAEDDPLIEATRQSIGESQPVQKILQQQRPAGYWGSDPQPHHGTKGPLMLLMWLGYRGDQAVKKAMDYRINGCLQKDGSYGLEIKGHTVFLPCHGADLLRLMLWFGYTDDPRSLQLLNWLLSVQQSDGIWLCISKVKPFPCLWATAVVLRALREIPPTWLTPQVVKARERTVDIFLNSSLYKYGKGKPSPRWFQFGFPLQWDTDILEVLELIAPYVSPEDKGIQEGLDLVMQKQDKQGRWPCEKHPKGGKWIEKYLPLEEIGQPSKWVTLHVYRLLKTLYTER